MQNRIVRQLLAAVIAAVSLSLVPAAANATPVLTVNRGGPAVSASFTAALSGAGILDVSVSAPRVSWGDLGSESAVVSLSVDGHYQSDLVMMSSTPTSRSVALGSLAAGSHTLSAIFAADRSPAGRAERGVGRDGDPCRPRVGSELSHSRARPNHLREGTQQEDTVRERYDGHAAARLARVDPRGDAR